LRREDLINSKGKPLVTAARLEAVWKRLSDRFATVVADTSMITMSTDYAAHFHDIYIDGKEHAKMTGDRMKMLMLTLPFMVRDLIAPEVSTYQYIPVHTSTYSYILVHTSTYQYILVCTSMYCIVTRFYQVQLINSAIDKAKKGSYLHGLPHVADPSTEVQEVLIACMNWNMDTRKSKIPEADLPGLQQKAVDLLDLLQKNLPDKTGEKAKWNFEKALSILHKVREILLWGNSDNTSCQSPEVCTSTYQYIPVYTSMYWYVLIQNCDLPLQHAHIDNIKSVANLSNNKDVFMCILRFHARAGYLQHYEALLKELEEHVPEDVVPQAVPDDQYAVECVALADRNHNLPSETGLRYPSLLVMNNRHLTTQRLSVICPFIGVHTSTYPYVLVHTSTYLYVLVCTLT
jgi:hypothetical protein